MDDMMDSVNTVEETIILAKKLRFIHKNGNFHKRNWLSNSRIVIEEGNPEEFCSAGKRADQIIEPTKVVGMWWDTNLHILTFNLKFTKSTKEIFEGENLPTKRQLLRFIMSIFGPLGIINLYLIDVKIHMQKVWWHGIGWDESIPEIYIETWKSWLEVLKEIQNIKIPRHYFQLWTHKDSEIELHVFVDAIEWAYATVASFRTRYKNSIHTSLIGSKTKLAPLKPICIPRMGLLPAVLGVRFATNILQYHDVKIEDTTYWSDSKTVLTWIKSDPLKYKQFVMYRIGEIQEATKAEQWSYVPTKFNIADLATKASPKQKFDLNSE